MSSLQEAWEEVRDYWRKAGYPFEPSQPSEDLATCIPCGGKWVRFEYDTESYHTGVGSPEDADDYVILRRVHCFECGHHRQQVWSPDAGEYVSEAGTYAGAWIEDGERSDLPKEVTA